MPVRNRPRIPTPDVTKEVMDREQQSRFTTSPAGIPPNHLQNNQQLTSGVALLPHQLPGGYPTGDVPVVQVVLSPIQELDGSGSVNNTLHAGQPGTAALAQAVLSPGLGPVLTTTPMTVSQLTTIGLTSVTNSPLLTQGARSPSFVRAFQPEKSPSPPVKITEAEADDVERLISSRNSNTSVGSDTSNTSKETKDSLASNHSNTTASVTSAKSLEDTPKMATQTVNSEFINMAIGEVRSRKTSATSQNNGNSPKRGEVYV